MWLTSDGSSAIQGLAAGPGRYHLYLYWRPLAQGCLFKEWFILCERVEGGVVTKVVEKDVQLCTYVQGTDVSSTDC